MGFVVSQVSNWISRPWVGVTVGGDKCRCRRKQKESDSTTCVDHDGIARCVICKDVWRRDDMDTNQWWCVLSFYLLWEKEMNNVFAPMNSFRIFFRLWHEKSMMPMIFGSRCKDHAFQVDENVRGYLLVPPSNIQLNREFNSWTNLDCTSFSSFFDVSDKTHTELLYQAGITGETSRPYPMQGYSLH